MRVAVHFPAEHRLAQADGPAVVAYQLGRIEDGVHNAPPGHDPVALEDFVARMIQRAQQEYPDADVRLERLVDNGDGTSRWVDASEFDPAQHVPARAGQTVNRDVAAAAVPAGG